jgi:hypothetical protein
MSFPNVPQIKTEIKIADSRIDNPNKKFDIEYNNLIPLGFSVCIFMIFYLQQTYTYLLINNK